jgi:cell division protein FtsB
MPSRLSQTFDASRLRRWLLLLGLAVGGVWFLFFDSYSLVRRVHYYTDYRDLAEENAHLQAEIDRLQTQLDAGLSDEVVEAVAREQYGMRRPGETVYPVDDRTERE